MRKIILAVFLSTFLIGPGCSFLNNKLPNVISAVTDGVMVLDTINSFVNAYFAAHPDAAKQATVESAIAKTRTSLDAALRIVNGASSLDQAQVDTAFADFRVAYTELTSLVESIGIKTAGTRLAASPHGLNVPEPLALKLKI